MYEEKWADAAAQLADVNGTPGGTSTFGYQLVANYGDIFKPDNKFNSESIFEIVHTAQARQDWGAWVLLKEILWYRWLGQETIMALLTLPDGALPAYYQPG